MNDDWYRLQTWTETDQMAFFARLKRSRGQYNKAQYLRIQAGYLGGNYPEESLQLLEMVIDDFPEPSELAQTYLQKARCQIALLREDESIEWFRKVLAQEKAHPRALTDGYLDFSTFVITTQRTDLYQEIEQVLASHIKRLRFAVDRYRYHCVMAVIRWHDGNIKEAQEHVKSAQEAASEQHSGFRYHPSVGLVKEQDEKLQDLFKEIEKA